MTEDMGFLGFFHKW